VLTEELLALAAAAGAAVAQGIGTDAWVGLRAGLGRWFGRGDAQREQGVLAELDSTAAAVVETGTVGEEARTRHEVVWRDRVRALLEDLDDAEREPAACALRELVGEGRDRTATAATTGAGSLTVQGDVNVRAEQGSLAAGVVNGDVSFASPQSPVQSQG
jgi:hypothetical protein